MAPAIQAGSLATVIDLADNPPAHLQDRTVPHVQQPLVLYIARVPGSKDVFLTTMKPRQKVITAQDVQSSLYYVHVDSPDDYQLLEDSNSDEVDPSGECSNKHTALDSEASVPRKPLPQNPKLGPNDRSKFPPLAYSHFQARTCGSNGTTQVSRTPIDQDIRPGHRSLDAAPALPPRKLLGPRSMDQRVRSVDSSALQNVAGRQIIDMRKWSEQPGATPPGLPPRPNSVHRKLAPVVSLRGGGGTLEEQRHPTNTQVSAEHCWEWEKSWGARRASEARKEMAGVASLSRDSEEPSGAFDDASLSLIRRYNGQQWNVAKIATNDEEHMHSKTQDGGSGIAVEIITPGYIKFTEAKYSDSIGAQTHAENPHGDPSLSKSEKSSPSIEGDRFAFRRHLQLARNAKRQSYRHGPELRESRNFQASVRSSFDHTQPSTDNFGFSSIETSGHGTSKGYIIQSPWNGVCEFTTGIAGRSLKCKHSYTSTDPRLGSGIFSASISELRFNLPSSKSLGSPAPKTSSSSTPREGKRSSFLTRSHYRKTSSSQDWNGIHDDEYSSAKIELKDRLNLSLGQEHAGGGFGGKQAKMGKLIVEAEGLQMLDLVVAANMALWWKVYEKIT